MPRALTSTRTWSGPGTGSGTSATETEEGPPSEVTWSERMGASMPGGGPQDAGSGGSGGQPGRTTAFISKCMGSVHLQSPPQAIPHFLKIATT